MAQSLQSNSEPSLDQYLDLIKYINPLSTRPESDRYLLDLLHAAYQHRQKNLLKHLWKTGALKTALRQDIRPPTDADIKFEAIEIALDQLKQTHAQLQLKAAPGTKIEESKLLREFKTRHKVSIIGTNMREHEYRNGPDQRTPRERARAVARPSPKPLVRIVLRRASRSSYFDDKFGDWLAANKPRRRYNSWLSSRAEYQHAEFCEAEKKRLAVLQSQFPVVDNVPEQEVELSHNIEALDDIQETNEAIASHVPDVITVPHARDYTKDSRSRRRVRSEEDAETSETEINSTTGKPMLRPRQDEPYGVTQRSPKRRAVGDFSVKYSIDTRLELEEISPNIQSCGAGVRSGVADVSRATRCDGLPLVRKSSRTRPIVGTLFRLATVA